MAYRYPYDEEDRPVEKKPVKLQTNRSFWKFEILNILTLGIYGIFFFIPFSFDLDTISPKRDHSKTMNYLFAYLLAFFTFRIILICWFYQITARIEEALNNRNMDYDFSTNDFWGWYFFGSLILIGPWIYYCKLCKAMNLLCENYNENPMAA